MSYFGVLNYYWHSLVDFWDHLGRVTSLSDFFSRFIVPISCVICNDIMAYMFGFFFGRTPLIKVSGSPWYGLSRWVVMLSVWLVSGLEKKSCWCVSTQSCLLSLQGYVREKKAQRDIGKYLFPKTYQIKYFYVDILWGLQSLIIIINVYFYNTINV